MTFYSFRRLEAKFDIDDNTSCQREIAIEVSKNYSS